MMKKALGEYIIMMSNLRDGNDYNKQWALTHAFSTCNSSAFDKQPLCMLPAPNNLIKTARSQFERYMEGKLEKN